MTNDEAKGLTDAEVNKLTEEQIHEILVTMPAHERAVLKAAANRIYEWRTKEQWGAFLAETHARYAAMAARPDHNYFMITVEGVTFCMLSAEVARDQKAHDASEAFMTLAGLFRKLRERH